MKKSWGLLPKILSGEKRIESRWYLNRSAPWGNIKVGETVYFKDSGEPVTMKAQVARVLQFDNLTHAKVKGIIAKYGRVDGLIKKDIPEFYNRFKDKRYCLLIFLEKPHLIKPFRINKKGFGLMSAWLTTDKIARLRV